jgi:hypothetical protein
MKIHIPKISFETLYKKQIDEFCKLNSRKYGDELALKVTSKLMSTGNKNNGIYFFHRDYCGIGIFFSKEKFILSTVNDYGIDKIIIELDSKTEFINWLSNENDQSMSLYGEIFNNQTITKLRLDWYLEENYSPVWNTYCQYVRESSVFTTSSKVENLINKLNLKNYKSDYEDFCNDDNFQGNSFRIDISGLPIETFKHRIELIDKAIEIEHQRLINDENSWAITGLKKLGEKWKEFDFEYGKAMLFNAIQYDLAYTNSKRMSVESAEKLYKLIISIYDRQKSFIYCNYNKSPWERNGYSGNNLTDDWTFDLGIILIDANKLTFNYFLSED